MEDDNQKPKKPKLPSSHVRFTESELRRMEKMQKATGLSIPEILKKNTFNRMDLERPLYDREHADRIITELKRVGNNLNQIARQINAGLMTGWSQSFNSLTRAFVDLRHLIAVNHANS